MGDPYVGQQVAGQFRILQKIGTGGMGAVYKAEQPEMNRFVAVKILHSKYLTRTDLVARFRREARAMSHLSHPNTARVFLYGQLDDGACYFIMEYLEGRNLAQMVRAHGPMEPERAINVMIQVCGALEEAHQAGIIHRDLKPENVFLTTQGGIQDYPKVLDFGLAKVTERQMRPGSMVLTQEGMVFGTPEFMSPEQARGEPLDARSDIYSLGTILYELVTGKLPFDAKQPMEYINMHINEPPIPLAERCPGKDFPPGLQAVLDKALAKSRDDRQEKAAELGKELRDVIRGKLITGVMRSLPSASTPPAAASSDARPEGPSLGTGQASAAVRADSSVVTNVPAAPATASPMGKLTWVVFGAGLLLAISGAIALAVAFMRS
ncbi:MAG: serine/threonine protein kinase [Deltaproteobacteria bacterium]|nr:serine/threonine protein kinase [Deltaproteobacteria bacterium]